jgi:hypothetical protein
VIALRVAADFNAWSALSRASPGPRRDDKKVMNVNVSPARTSARIQTASNSVLRDDRRAFPAPREARERRRRHQTNTENIMLRKFAGVLVATALIAGPAFAVQPTGDNGAAAPAGHHAAAKHAKSTKHVKIMTQAQKHAHKHVAHGKLHRAKQARHLKPAPTHKAAQLGKSAKAVKS